MAGTNKNPESKNILRHRRILVPLLIIGGIITSCTCVVTGGFQSGNAEEAPTPTPNPPKVLAPSNTAVPARPTPVPVPTFPYRYTQSMGDGGMDQSAPIGACYEVGEIRPYQGFVVICSRLCANAAGNQWVQKGSACIDMNGKRTIP